MILYLLYLVLFVVLLLLVFLKRRHTYWTRHGIYQIEPEFLFGNTKGMMMRTKSWAQHYLEFHNHMKEKGLQYGGVYMFTVPILLVIDPKLIKTILLKDFDYFMNHGVYVNEEVEPLTGHLFNLEDQKWRNLRIKLTPTFTSGKMKMMFQTFVECTDGLREIIEQYAADREPINIKDILARFTTDVIGNCALGVECNTMKNPNSEFRVQSRKSFELGSTDALMQMLVNALPLKVSEVLGIRSIRPEVEKFFMSMVKQTVDYREKNNIHRKDFMHLLLQLKNQGQLNDEENNISNSSQTSSVTSAITFAELAAQCYVFFLAGFETSSTTMTFALFELAANPDIQDKLRSEMNTVLDKHDNKVTYEAIMEMKYLENVIFEALRKYPPLPVIIRQCTKPYKIPGSDIVLEKGRRVQFSIIGLQMDPKYYPEPEKFNPDRFNEENRAKREPFTWLPFGEGPRQCIGIRFGLLQSKVGLVSILRNYRVSVNRKTKVPLELDPCNWMTSAKGNIWLDVQSV